MVLQIEAEMRPFVAAAETNASESWFRIRIFSTISLVRKLYHQIVRYGTFVGKANLQ